MHITLDTIKHEGQEEKFRDAKLQRTGYVAHRMVSKYITLFLLTRFPRISATGVTQLAFLVSLVGAVCLYFWGTAIFFVGIGLLYLGFLLDKVDGEVARVQKRFSVRGVFLDDLMHFVIPVVCLVAAFFDMLFAGGVGALLVLLACVFSLLNRYVLAKVHYGIAAKFTPERFAHMTDTDRYRWVNRVLGWRVWSVFSVLMRFDLFLLFFGIVGIAGIFFPEALWYALVYSAGSLGIVFFRASLRLYCVKLLHKVRHIVV